MATQEFMSTIQVGSKVGIACSGSWTTRYSFGVVRAIHKNGNVILENGDKYNKYGDQIGGSKYHTPMLVSVEVAEANIASQNAQRERDAKLKALEEKITSVTRGHKNGYGNFFGITEEEKNELITMLNGLVRAE